MSSSTGNFARALAGRTGKLVGVGLAGLIVLSSQGGAWADITDPTSPDPSASPSAAGGDPAGDYIVRFSAGVSDAQQRDDLAAVEATISDTVAPLNLYSVSLTESAATSLRAEPDVLGVETNKLREVQGAPSDPSYDGQWALPKIGWDSAYGSVGVNGAATVAVLDTGVNATDDLSGQLVDGASMIDGAPGTADPNGHGTAMASIVAAGTHNNTGIAGVGYQGVSVMPVKVLGADGAGQDSDIVRGVVYAADHGADVILMSFANPGRSAALQAAADYAWSKGAVLVAATGNDASTTDTFPAGLAKVVGVSATDRDDRLWASSNSGADTFLAAPGVDIATGSGTVSGTSASAAIVAGTAALLRAHDPSASNDVVVGRLARDADPAGSISDTGNGRVNLARALADTSTDPVVPQGVSGNGGPVVGPYVAADHDLGLTFAGTGGGIIKFSPAGLAADCSASCSRSLSNNQVGMLTVTPSAGSTFVGWSGPWDRGPQGNGTTTCTGSANPCTFNMGNNVQALTATFSSCTPPSISQQPSAQSITYGANASFTAASGSSPAPSVQWQFSTDNGQRYNPVAGATSTTLFLTRPKVADRGLYRAVFSNSCGSTTSNPVLLTVAPKNLNISGAVAQDRAYDSTKNATVDFTQASLQGVVSGDVVSIDSSAYSASFADKAIGAGKAVTVTGVGLGSGAVAANYTLSQPTGLTASITAFGLTISGVSVADKTYDGKIVATLVGTPHLVGVQGTDTVVLGTSGATAAFRSAGVASGKAVDVSGFTISGGDASNYTLSQPNGLTAGITPAPLTVVPEQATTTYGAGDPTTTYHLDGFVNGETRNDAGVTGAPVCTIGAHDPGAGIYPGTVSCSTANLAAANYSFTRGAAAALVINPAKLTVTPNAIAETYGDTDPTPMYQLTGFVNGETRATAGISGNAGCAIAAHGLDTGSYLGVITCTVGDLAAANYIFQPGAAADLVINPAVLTVAPRKATKTYGDDDPAATYVLDGFVKGEDETSAQVQGQADCVIGTHGEDAGTYPGVVTCAVGSLQAADYTFTPGAAATLEIGQAVLHVDADSKAKTYGASDPTLTYQLSGFVKGEQSSDVTITGTAACSRETGQAVGSYSITCQPNTLATPNYSFVAGAPAQLTIGQAVLHVDADAKSKTYGDGDPSLTASISGFVNGDTDSVVHGDASCSRADGEDAGSYTITCEAGTLSARDYSFVTGSSADLKIDRAVLRVDADPKSKTYGQQDPDLTATLSGFVNDETASTAGITGSAACSRADGENADSYTITCRPSSLAARNYTFETGDTAQLVIHKAVLTVVAEDAEKTYGGTEPPATYHLGDFVNGENRSSAGVTGDADCSIADHAPDAGTYSGVVTCTAGGLTARNYSFATGPAADLVIHKAPLTLTARDVSKVYGDDLPAFTFKVDGLANGDTVTSALTDGPTFGTSADKTSIVGTYPITVSDATSDNYTLTYLAGTLTVTKAPLTLKADPQSRTYGDDNLPLTFSAVGLVNGDSAHSALTTDPTLGTAAANISDVGTYPITIADAASHNYSLSYTDSTLTIDQAPLTITAADKTKKYGDANPRLTGTVDGIKNGDGITATYSTSADESTGVGSYAIVPTAVDSDPSKLGNYDVTLVNATLTIGKAPLTITAAKKSKTYGDSNPALTGTIDGIKNGDGITATYSTRADKTTGVGSYDIVPTALDSEPSRLGNYDVSYVNGTLTIEARPLAITARDRTKTYGDALALGGTGFSAPDGQLVNDDSVASVTLASDGAAATAHQGSYDVVASDAVAGPDTDLGNYAVTYAKGTLTVDARALTITADDRTKTYGDALTLGGTAFSTAHGELVNGDTVVSVTLTSSGATAAATKGRYDVVASGAVAGGDTRLSDYSVTYKNGSLTVGAAPLTITAADKTRVYGDANPSLTGSIDGLKNGDAITASYSTSADPMSGVGTYDILASAVDASPSELSNYDVTVVKGTLTVTKAALTVRVNDATKLLNAVNPAFSATITGARNGDVITPTFSTTATTTSGIGSYSITPSVTLLTSADILANYEVTLQRGTLTVVYGWNGYLQPVNDTAHQVGLKESKFKLGQTIPLKFDLTDANGVSVQQSGNPTFSRSANLGSCDANATVDSVPTVSPDAAAVYGYSGGHYQYNWSTKGALAAGEYKVFANLADGTSQYTYICLTK